MARQHFKVIQYNGKLTPVVEFKTWWGRHVEGVRVGSSSFYSKKRKTYNKHNVIGRAVA